MKKISCLLILFVLYTVASAQKFDHNQAINADDILSKTLIVKIKPSVQINGTEIQNAFKKLDVSDITRVFPNHNTSRVSVNQWNQSLVDLSLIYEIKYQADFAEVNAAAHLQSYPFIEYAQPYFLVNPMAENATMWTPSDPFFMYQWYLKKIKADLAWNLDTGSTNVIIAVVDGGTNFNHPELTSNIAYNTNDPIDGIDNDNDGYVDNYYGWDLGDDDNYPQYQLMHSSDHGTAMTGVAGSTTNEGYGIANVAYSCKYLPVKIVNTVNGWTHGYQGIVYAADHGAQIINCSWGNFYYAPFEQDVVNYASINKNALVIAAAGNSNNTDPIYPASYEYVLAVGGVDSFDVKSPSSSFYEFVDIVSPGFDILTTYRESYTGSVGTSIASALTAGAAGLLKSFYPSYHPLQIAALIQQTTDRIDTISGNASFANKQGSGRLNVYSAMINTQLPHIYFYNKNIEDVVSVNNDTISLSGDFINYLANASAQLSVEISSLSPQYIHWIDSTVQLGALGTMVHTSNSVNPFRFVVASNCPNNYFVTFKLVFSDGVRLNTQYFRMAVNVNYKTIKSGNLELTITSTGRLGFADIQVSRGIGLKYKNWGNQLLEISYNPMGFWVAESNTKVVNQSLAANLISCCPLNTDNHFVTTQPLHHLWNSGTGVTQLESKYSDANAGSNTIGIEITQRSSAYSTPQDSNIIVLEYSINNKTANGKSNLFTGIYTDVDMCDTIFDRAKNYAFYDTTNSMGVLQNVNGKMFIGIKTLSPLPISYYAFNTDGSDPINITNGFSTAEKWQTISNGLLRTKSDTTDISQLIALKIDTLAPNSCTSVFFAVLAADNLADLRQRAMYIQQKFNAEYNFWTGNANNDNWHDSNNWSKLSIPTPQDFVIIPDVSTLHLLSPRIYQANGTAKNVRVLCNGKLKIENQKELIVK